MQTAKEHADLLANLADELDPRTESKPTQTIEAADALREAAQHLHRIATGGDAKASDEAGD